MKGAIPMAKISNIVRLIEFDNVDQLYYSLGEDMDTNLNVGDTRCYRVKDIKLINDNQALVYFEEDLQSVRAHFFYNEKEIILQDCPYNDNFLSYQEIGLMNELGSVTLDDTTYDIENIEYCIDNFGVRYIEIVLN